MGLKAIQPWHYGFCDVSHAQSAAAIASGEKSGAFTLGSRVFIPRYFFIGSTILYQIRTVFVLDNLKQKKKNNG